MAKDGDGKKKKKKAVTADLGGVKIKVKAGKRKGDKPGKAKKSSSPGALDAIAKLAESPLVADLIAVGATAAVAALAQSMTDREGKRSKASVKDAGKAAASAIGKRLVTEFETLKEAGKKA